MDSSISASSNIHLAPELPVSGSKFPQKCDVYSFGVVLLELLIETPDAGPENNGMTLEIVVRKAFREEHPLLKIIDPAFLPKDYAKKQIVAALNYIRTCVL